MLERAVAPETCDRLRADLDAAFAQGDERLLMHSPTQEDYQPLEAGADVERVRVVDVFAFYESARAALFSEPIVRFLRTAFDDTPLLFQSLTFEKGSQQPVHQDPIFVVTTSPLEFAASWIALEDIRPGSGELTYLDCSHRTPEYLFSGKYKHWNATRDGQHQLEEWRSLMQATAEDRGYEQKTFCPRKGDVLIWAADLVHGGSPVSDPALTRKSIVGHYCPSRVDPFYFKLHPNRRATGSYDGGSTPASTTRLTASGRARQRARRAIGDGAMHETHEDLRSLQEVLDTSYARAGSHLRSIWGEETRLGAEELGTELEGVQVLDLATVTPRGEPRVAPVDGLFFRGQLWFGSAESSQRFRNIRANPAVSAAITRGLETFLVIVHGRAIETDPRSPEARGFADYPRKVYDFDWDAEHSDAPYARIEAQTMLAFKRR